MKKQLLLSLFLTPLLMASTIEIYNNKTFLKEDFLIKDYSIKSVVPNYVNYSNLNIESNCKVDDMMLSKYDNEKYLFKRKILNEENTTLKNKLNRLEKINASFQYINSDDFINHYKYSENLFDEYNKLLNKNKEELQELYKEKTINSLKDKKLNLTFDCKENNTSITYPIFLNYSYQNKINIKDKIEISENIYIKSKKDYKDIELIVYPYVIDNRIFPKKYSPIYVYKHNTSKNINTIRNYNGKMNNLDSISFKEKVSRKEINTKFNKYHKLQHVNLLKDSPNIISIDKITTDYTQEIEIPAYDTLTAYNTIKFTLNKSISEGNYGLSLYGKDLGNTNIKFNKGENKIYAGVNRDIIVTKKEIKNETKNTIMGNEIKNIYYDIDIVNESVKSYSINYIDRIPVSKSGNIEIEFNSPNIKYNKATGKLEKYIILKANSSIKLKIMYKIKTDK